MPSTAWTLPNVLTSPEASIARAELLFITVFLYQYLSLDEPQKEMLSRPKTKNCNIKKDSFLPM
jgi:hypothetical protein